MGNVLFDYASFGNVPFWLVAVLLFHMATLVFFYGKFNWALPSLTIDEHPFLQKELRFSLLLILVLCPFVECDYLFAEVTDPIGKSLFVYMFAAIGFYLFAGTYVAIACAVMCLNKIIKWALGDEPTEEVINEKARV